MKEFFSEIPTSDGTLETFVTHPEDGGPYPPVIVYMDIWGVREELWDIARRIGTVGYYAMVPDLYYRQGGLRFEFRDAQGRAQSVGDISQKDRDRVLAAAGQISDAMVVRDTAAMLAFADGQEAARSGPAGSIGYCMGGRHVLAVAGNLPDRFRASASLHGTAMVSDASDSPHLLAHNFRGEIYCGFGGEDSYTPPELVETLADLLGECPVDYRYVVHDGAKHGYALPDRNIYDKHAANRDWEIIFAMFRRQLG